MKYFVHIHHDYYPGAGVFEADTAEEAIALAKQHISGDTYGNLTFYEEPAIAVVPFDFVEFHGSPARIAELVA